LPRVWATENVVYTVILYLYTLGIRIYTLYTGIRSSLYPQGPALHIRGAELVQHTQNLLLSSRATAEVRIQDAAAMNVVQDTLNMDVSSKVGQQGAERVTV
jgi:hypothetical protein